MAFQPFSIIAKIRSWFSSAHLPEHLAPTMNKYHALADDISNQVNADADDTPPDIKAHVQLAVNDLWNSKNHAIAALAAYTAWREAESKKQ